MPIIAFLLWALVIAFVGGGWVCSGVLTLFGFRRKWRVMKWVYASVFAGFSLVALAGVGLAVHGLIRSSVPRYVFEETFGEPVPAGTTVLHGSAGGFADSAGRTLAFKTDRATFDRLRPQTLERASLERYRLHSNDKPGWWREPRETTEIWMHEAKSYENQGRMEAGQIFAAEWTVMTWDTDGLAQYSWLGID